AYANEKVPHPFLEQYRQGGPSALRAVIDFQPLAWFASEVTPPQCLQRVSIEGINDAGERVKVHIDRDQHMGGLLRIALGFRAVDIGAIRWPDHPGYCTGEGRYLNDTARECGDDPDKWFVTEENVNLDHLVEIWTPRSADGKNLTGQLRLDPDYLIDVR